MKKISFLFILGALLSHNLVYAQTEKTPQEIASEELSKQAEERDKLAAKCDNSAMIDFYNTGKWDEKKIAEAARHCRKVANMGICVTLFDQHPACLE